MLPEENTEDQSLANELMPNSSESIPGIWGDTEIDQEIRKEEAEEKVKIATALPLLEELLQWFDENITAADSIKNLMAIKQARGITLDNALIARDIVRTLLESQRDDLISRFDDYMTREDENG